MTSFGQVAVNLKARSKTGFGQFLLSVLKRMEFLDILDSVMEQRPWS